MLELICCPEDQLQLNVWYETWWIGAARDRISIAVCNLSKDNRKQMYEIDVHLGDLWVNNVASLQHLHYRKETPCVN